MVVEVDPEGAAAEASLRAGDILLGSFDALNEALDSGRDVLRLQFSRGDREQGAGGVRTAGSEGGSGVIRLMIVAPSAVIRAGLEALAVSGLEVEVVGSLADFSAVETLRPDVVLAASADGRDFPAGGRTPAGVRAAGR